MPPQQKHFPCKEVLKKAKEKTFPCFTHGGNWMSCLAPIFRSRGILSQDQGFFSSFFLLSFFNNIFCGLDVSSKGFVFFSFFFFFLFLMYF